MSGSPRNREKDWVFNGEIFCLRSFRRTSCKSNGSAFRCNRKGAWSADLAAILLAKSSLKISWLFASFCVKTKWRLIKIFLFLFFNWPKAVLCPHQGKNEHNLQNIIYYIIFFPARLADLLGPTMTNLKIEFSHLKSTLCLSWKKSKLEVYD